MPRLKLYDYDPILAKTNKILLQERKGEKWKQLRILEELEDEIKQPNSQLPFLAHKFRKIAKKTTNNSIRQQALMGYECASEKARNTLQSRLIVDCTHGHPLQFVSSHRFLRRMPLSTQNYKRLLDSIRLRGILIPIIVTEENEIIDGEARVSIAKELELPDIPYITINLRGLPEVEKTRVILDTWIALNMDRRHLSIEDRKSLNRQRRSIQEQSIIPGRPTNEEVHLAKKLKMKGRMGLNDMERVLASVYNLKE